MSFLHRLESEFPAGVIDMLGIPGLGPKTVVRIWKELDVTSITELEAAVDDGRVASLPRMGKKSAENIQRSIQFARSKSDRFPIARAMDIARRVTEHLRGRCPEIEDLVVCGSLRRFEETVGDLDLVCVTADMPRALDALASMDTVADVIGHGAKKTSVVLDSGMQGRSQGYANAGSLARCSSTLPEICITTSLSGRSQPGRDCP